MMRRAFRWSRDSLPKAAYIAMTGAGMIFIWVAKVNEWDASLTIGVPVALLLSYFLMAAVLGAFRFHDEQTGDNLYYMGFLYTLTSLGVALYRYDVAASVDRIVHDFGLAVLTTICGIAFRILYNQVRHDPIDIERSTRHELAEMTRRVRAELEAASREFSNFRRASNQMLEEGFEEINQQAEKSGEQILKIMESLSQEAVKPVSTAGKQLHDILDDVGKSTEARLSDAAQRMDAATTGFEDANSRMIETVRSFGEKVETAGSKLAEVKTPDEIIHVKLKPTLSALEKLVNAHGEKLDASDHERGKEIEAIRQTHEAVTELTSVVERSVAAMEKAVEATSHSQRATENLTQLIQQQNDDLRQHLEKVANDQGQSLARRIVDEVSTKLGGRTASQSLTGGAPARAPETTTAPQVDTPSPELSEQKRWWPLR